jgi:hypothetical protein
VCGVRVALWRVCVVSAPRVMAQKLTRGVLCGRAVLPELFPPPPSSSIVTPSPTPPLRTAGRKFHNKNRSYFIMFTAEPHTKVSSLHFASHPVNTPAYPPWLRFSACRVMSLF